jgi:hypothetical protein
MPVNALGNRLRTSECKLKDEETSMQKVRVRGRAEVVRSCASVRPRLCSFVFGLIGLHPRSTELCKFDIPVDSPCVLRSDALLQVN